VRLASGDVAGAVAAWNQLIDVAPERAHLALARLERLYEQEGALQKFVEQCRAFIAGRPHDWRVRLTLGAHLTRRGQAADAFNLLLEALEQNPHGLTVHQAVWTALLQLDLHRPLVQRYIEAARGAVFFLDPHVCLKCHYRSTELLWQCPHCHEWNSFVEERIAAARQASAEM
jgi:lipopolysaccharide biosynthesis regulator YciM